MLAEPLRCVAPQTCAESLHASARAPGLLPLTSNGNAPPRHILRLITPSPAMSHVRSPRTLLGLGLIVVLAIALLFGVQAVRTWQSLQQPPSAQLDASGRIEPWMTMGYLAARYRVPRAEIAAQLGVAPDQRVTLHEIAQTRGISDNQEIRDAASAIATLQNASPVAPPPDPRGPTA